MSSSEFSEGFEVTVSTSVWGKQFMCSNIPWVRTTRSCYRGFSKGNFLVWRSGRGCWDGRALRDVYVLIELANNSSKSVSKIKNPYTMGPPSPSVGVGWRDT